MKENPIVPTVQQAQAQELAELMRQAEGLHVDILNADRMNVRRAWELGKVLRQAKDRCPHSEWGARLEQIGIRSKRRAQQFMRIAKCAQVRILEFVSIIEALRACAEEDKNRAQQSAQSGTLILCRNCRIFGAKSGCKKCERVRNGEPIMAWPKFHNRFGHVVRAASRIANAGDVKHMEEAMRLEDELDAWYKRLAAFYEKVTGSKAPSI